MFMCQAYRKRYGMATLNGIHKRYRLSMTREQPLPGNWVRLCRALGLAETVSIDRVLAAVHEDGKPVVGRGTIQRIREAKGTRITSLERLAEFAGVPVGDLVSDQPEEPQRAEGIKRADIRASVDAIVDALEAMDHQQRARAARAFALIADDPSVDSMRQAFADFMDPAQDGSALPGELSRKPPRAA